MRILLISIFLLIVSITSYFGFEKEYPKYVFAGPKLKGISLVAPSKPVGIGVFDTLKKTNAEWISLMPYSFLPKNSAEIQFQKHADTLKQGFKWWGEKPEGVKACIELAKQKGLKVMLKPHLWIGWGTFTGDLDFKTEAEWQKFEKSYAEYILMYAQIAAIENVEMLCIGTEMAQHVKKRPEFWIKLIEKTKSIYKGKITYAENWDTYKDVPFWANLDFIGIDGYFPLSEKKDPNLEQLEDGWKKHIKDLEKFSNKNRKPILFTELGYRSCDYSTKSPWETDFTLPENETLQAKAFTAFFETLYKQAFFAGIFVWKWFPETQHHGHKDLFSPQGKEAEKVLTDYFSRK